MKRCSECQKEFKSLWKAKSRSHGAMCGVCWRQYQSKQNSDATGLKIGKVTMYSFDKYKKRKKTGEWDLFCKIYAERKGLCEITGDPVKLEPSAFAHVLSKGAYERYRLNPDNIIMCKPEIHDMYDNGSKDKLLAKYPSAIKFYEKKDELRYKYYNE